MSALVASVALSLGCASADDVITPSTDSNSADGSGTYDFAATFQTFTGLDPAANCLVGSCPHKTVAISPGSSLAGVMVLAAATPTGAGLLYPVTRMELSEVDCRGGASCFTRTVAYGRPDLTLSPAKTLSSTTAFTSSGEGVYLTSGLAAGDSITGNLDWYVFYGVASESYSGTYVARRRH